MARIQTVCCWKRRYVVKTLGLVFLASTFALFHSNSYAIDQNDPAWVAAWTFDEGAGDEAADVINGNDGIFVGDIGWDSGILGDAILINGGGSIDVQDSPSILSLSEEMTVAAWFRVDSSSNTGIRKNGAFLLEDQSDTEPFPDAFSFRIWTDQGLSPGLYGKTPLEPGQWYHVAATYDGVLMELYVNGVPESLFGTFNDQGVEWEPEWSGELQVGSPLQLKFGPEQYTGAMDEVMLLNRALTADEIGQIIAGWDSLAPDVDCDFDGNQVCDLADIDALTEDIAAGNNTATFDLNDDGLVNLADSDAWIKKLGTLPGDANLDGDVNAGDLNVVGINWQSSSNKWSEGNFDGISGVTAGDLNIVGINWQQSGEAPLAAAVPEPTTQWMILLGLAGVLLRRRRSSPRTGRVRRHCGRTAAVFV